MLSTEQQMQLQNFFNRSNFSEYGGVITDLDGTAIHEHQGNYSIPKSVELGLKKIYDLGRPIVLNTLRFPLSVIRTFGDDWYNISRKPIPTVLMNGSQLGYVTQSADGEIVYDEIAAFPLLKTEIDAAITIVQEFISHKMHDLLVFYYPRDWKKGEIIWTPLQEKVTEVRNKYLSAETVYSADVKMLYDNLYGEEICMIFLLIDLPQDKLMAYQHSKKSNFFTTAGTDKLSGAESISRHLQFNLEHSVGAGDTEMDTFLKGVGQPVFVGNNALSFKGLSAPIKLSGSSELGELLFQLAAMQKTQAA